jgi:hypothetical protein
MIDIPKLRGLIVEKGYTQTQVAEHIGISPKTFYERMKKGVFGSDEIDAMIDLLDISNPVPIFFKRK